MIFDLVIKELKENLKEVVKYIRSKSDKENA